MILIKSNTFTAALWLSISVTVSAQNNQPLPQQEKAESAVTLSPNQPEQKVIVVTGARFSYKLVEKWIDDYDKVNPNVQIIVESRGSADPLKYDILAEVYEQDVEIKKDREYVNVARYAILPVATAHSSFAKIYADKGLNAE